MRRSLITNTDRNILFSGVSPSTSLPSPLSELRRGFGATGTAGESGSSLRDEGAGEAAFLGEAFDVGEGGGVIGVGIIARVMGSPVNIGLGAVKFDREGADLDVELVRVDREEGIVMGEGSGAGAGKMVDRSPLHPPGEVEMAGENKGDAVLEAVDGVEDFGFEALVTAPVEAGAERVGIPEGNEGDMADEDFRAGGVGFEQFDKAFHPLEAALGGEVKGARIVQDNEIHGAQRKPVVHPPRSGKGPVGCFHPWIPLGLFDLMVSAAGEERLGDFRETVLEQGEFVIDGLQGLTMDEVTERDQSIDVCEGPAGSDFIE